MRYRIEYAFGGYCSYPRNRKELLEELKRTKREMISDIRKLYKSGVSDSVLEKYQNCTGSTRKE